MQYIIDIPEHMKKSYEDMIKHCDYKTFEIPRIVVKSIANGTPLPKGHGRLGDLDKIWSKLKELEEHYQAEFLKESNVIHESAMNGRLYGFSNAKFIVQDAPTIIEADKESELNERK